MKLKKLENDYFFIIDKMINFKKIIIKLFTFTMYKKIVLFY
jgi:hypothetical protein